MNKSIIVFFGLFITLLHIFPQEDEADKPVILGGGVVISTFGDNDGDDFQTSLVIKVDGENGDVYAIDSFELFFYNKGRKDSINYSLGDFLYFENEDKIRYNYSHLEPDSINYNKTKYNTNDVICKAGSSGNTSETILSIEIENTAKKILINPIEKIKIEDNFRPYIEDVYFIDTKGTQISLFKSNTVYRGGKIFVKCRDRISNINYNVTPYKISLFINGKEMSVLTFDYLTFDNENKKVGKSALTYDEVYQRKTGDDYFLLDYYSLPGLVGIKVIVEDYAGNLSQFIRAVRVLSPQQD